MYIAVVIAVAEREVVMRWCWLLVVMVVSLCSLHAEETQAAQALAKIRAMQGRWEGTFEWSGARSSKGKMDAEYYVTGNGSAVVENLLSDGQPSMTTVYHLDGSTLRMTHFCAATNQPRLKADRIDLSRNEIDFGFVDITNLKSPDSGHVHGLEWRMIDANHMTLTFIFQAGEKQSRELIQLKRSAPNRT
jgi:hypothetical protein